MQAYNYEHIIVEKAEGRMRLTLNRPDKRNALSFRMQTELNHALLDADNDKSIHCVIIRGAGRDFCAGFDLQDSSVYGPDGLKKSVIEHYGLDKKSPRQWQEQIRVTRKIEDDIWNMEEQQRLQMTIFDMHKPVIVAVHGNCLAGGIGIAFLADIVVAAEDAQIGFPPARDFGVLPTNMLMYHTSPQWAKRLLITGDSISGRDAAKIGLVLKAVPEGSLGDEVEGLADRMALIDPGLLTWNKRCVNLSMELMGARTMQRFNVMLDGMGHQAGTVYGGLGKQTKDAGGLANVFKRRNAQFGEGVAHADVPEGRLRPKALSSKL
mmetsp:Transcript_33008/g.102413  ORF Transcript_33008/g.102413 Transcript_33008/m.102413 type:complete len:322 (-) Transcript_33008:90-1055(-)